MKHKLLLLIFLFSFNYWAEAQVLNTVVVPALGNGTSGLGRGPVTQSLFHRSVTIYKASELAGLVKPGDSIARVGWVIQTVAGSAISGNIKIFMCNTSDSTNLRGTSWASILTTPTAMDTNYNGAMTIPNATGNYSVALSKKFVYNGGGIYVAYEWAPTASSAFAAVYSCNTGIPSGQTNAQSNSAFPATLTGGSAFRPQVVLGVVAPNLDAQITEFYSLGKLPIPYALPHQPKALLRNGGQDTLFNFPVTLDITGANTFTDVQVIDTFVPATSRLITFAGFSPTNTGNNVLVVSVPNDSNNSNNSKTFNQNVNLNTYSYADPTLPSIGGVGITPGTGDFVAKFPYTGTNSINQIGVNFFGAGASVKVGIWDTSATGTPGTLLWQSSTFTAATGLNTIPVNPPIAISGSFFVGVLQVGSTNASFGFQNESPIRSGTFFFTSGGTGTNTWNDFSVGPNPFRFMIEPRLQLADDVGLTDLVAPCRAVVINSAVINPKARVFNYGNLAQTTPFQVKCVITGPVNYTDSTSIVVNAGDFADVTFPGTFNPTVAGTYTVKVYTELGADGDKANDTLTTTFVINDINLGNNAVNRLIFDGTDDFLNVAYAPTLSGNNTLTLEAWVSAQNFIANRTIFSKDLSVADREYNFYINPLGQLVFVLQTSMGTDSVMALVQMQTSTMYHVAAVYDGAEMLLYLNGKQVGSKAFTGSIIGRVSPLVIGRYAASASQFFLGQMDELRIWNTARTAHEIRSNMHTRLANFSDPSLMMYLRLDEGAGNNVATDASGNCNSAVLSNMDAVLAWTASQIPLGSPVVASQTISASGTVPFAGTNLEFNTYNYMGAASETYYVHYFGGQPLGTLPSTIPGGVTDVHNNYWEIYQYDSATYDSIRVRFTFVPGNGVNPAAVPSDFVLFSRQNAANGGWNVDQNGASDISSPSNYAEFTITSNTSFGRQFSIGANNNSLPVEYLYFKGARKSKDAMLDWATASEMNSGYFEIERSFDNKNFENIGRVKAAGNSAAQLKYMYADRNVFAGGVKQAYYRLKQVDLNGSFEYTKTVLIREGGEMMIESVAPNPFNSEFTLSFNATGEEKATVEIYNVTGKLVKQLDLSTTSGTNTVVVNELAGLPGGMYLLILKVGDQKLTHKMMK